MLIFFFLYGNAKYKVRTGGGRCPLVYAAYHYNEEKELPEICGQSYRTVTEDQWDWLHDHVGCDVSYTSDGWDSFGDVGGTLSCKNHGREIKSHEDVTILDTEAWDIREV